MSNQISNQKRIAFIDGLSDIEAKELSNQYKWNRMDQTVYANNNEESEDETNYDLFIDTLQTIAVQLKKQQ